MSYQFSVMSTMSTLITLNCYVLGDGPNHFPITIDVTESVGALKEAIREKRLDKFGHVHPESLNLWAASIPLSHEFLGTTLVPKGAQELLMTYDRIKEHFQQADASNLQVLIERPPPPLKLWCYLLGDEPSGIFSVEIAATKDVGMLKDAIRAKDTNAFRDVGPNQFDLWKVSFPTGRALINSVNDYSFAGESKLSPLELLSEVFLAHPAEGHVHIIIQVPFVAREERFNTQSRPWPSSLARPVSFKPFQAHDEFYPCCHPLEREPDIPLALLDPAFATFIEESRSVVPTREDYAVARSLRTTMCAFHEYRETRTLVLHGLRCYDMFVTPKKFLPSGYQVDGQINCNNRPALILMVRDQAKAADPSIQAMLYYDMFCYDYELWKSPSLHPCFILSLGGPYLAIGGCVLSDRPMMETFTHLPLNFHETDNEACDALARHLSALKRGVNSLVARFSHSSSAGPPPPRSLSPRNRYHLFPYPTTFTSLSGPDKGEQVEFSYTEDVGEKSLIFVAETKDKGKICIKFVRRYGEGVHCWCSERGFAPSLLGFERLAGGWFMVVTENLDESWVRLSDANKTESHKELKGPIQAAIAQLHEEGRMVHGDISSTNIMVKKTEGLEFMLVNFDWAGRIGEVDYPKNPDLLIGRAAVAEHCSSVLPEHDDHLLQHTFSSFLRQL